jgi:hypothetical protein
MAKIRRMLFLFLGAELDWVISPVESHEIVNPRVLFWAAGNAQSLAEGLR